MNEESPPRFGQGDPPRPTHESEDAKDDHDTAPQRGWRQAPTPPGASRSSFGASFRTRNDHEDRAPGGVTKAAPEEHAEKPKRSRKAAGPTHPRHSVAVVSEAVKITRDASGVPHIRAEREHDAWAALGFCIGQDRLWQLDLLRRLALGRSAEILGARWARHDAIVRTAGIGRRATAAARRLGGIGHETLAAYAGGVNAARALGQPPEAAHLEYEVEPWTVADTLAIEIYWGWSLSREVWPMKLLTARVLATAGAEAARRVSRVELAALLDSDERLGLWAGLDDRITTQLRPPDLEPMAAAIGFAVSAPGALAPVLAVDLHGSPSAPCVAYMAHMATPDFAVAGLVALGTPIFLAGRNRNIAWGANGLVVDDADVVIEDLDGIGNFRGQAGRERLAVRREVIRIRDGDDLRIEVAETRNGPLFSNLANQLDGPVAEATRAVAVRWGANSLGTSLPGWLTLAKAGNVSEATAAVDQLSAGPVSWEFAIADQSGTTRGLLAGSLPRRSDRNQLPVRGWHAECRWSGVRPLEGRTAFAVLGGGRFGDGSDHAYAEPADRRERLEVVLAGEQLSPEAAILVLSDLADGGAAKLAGELASALDSSAPDALLFGEWNGAATPDSRAAALFWVAVGGFLPQKIFPAENFGELLEDGMRAYRALRLRGLDASGDRSAVAAALAEARAWLVSEFGADENEWTWERVCGGTRRHPLAEAEPFAAGVLPSRPIAGSPGAIACVRFAEPIPPLRVGRESAGRLVCDLSTTEIRLSLASGVAGASSSPHFADQARTWSEGRLQIVTLGKQAEGALSELVP